MYGNSRLAISAIAGVNHKMKTLVLFTTNSTSSCSRPQANEIILLVFLWFSPWRDCIVITIACVIF